MAEKIVNIQAHDTLTHVDQYIQWGWHPIPGKYRTKIPLDSDWNDQSFEDIQARREHFEYSLEKNKNQINIGIINDTSVDVDLDRPSARDMARHLFTPTVMLARKSAPNSHYIYTAEGTVRSKQFRVPKSIATDEQHADLGQMSVEVRGLDVNGRGQYTVVGPSIHVSGEFIKAIIPDSGHPLTINQEDVYIRAMLCVIGDVMSQFWQKGQRHDLNLALSGMLLKCHIEPDLVEQTILGICGAAGDEEAMKRLADVQRTVQNLRSGKAIIGEKRIAEICGDEVVDLFKQWIGDCTDYYLPPDLTTITQNDIPITPPELSYPYIVHCMGNNKFTNLANSDEYVMDGLNLAFQRQLGKGAGYKIANNCIRVNGMTYEPGENLVFTGAGYSASGAYIEHGVWANTYRPSPIKPKPGDVSAFKEHIASLSDWDEEQTAWLTGYLALCIQQPKVRCTWMPILIGGKGTGKSAICTIMAKILGPHNVKNIDAATFTGSWDDVFIDKQFVMIEEIQGGQGMRMRIGHKLKHYITAETLSLNPKYKAVKHIPNYVHLLGSSNEIIPQVIERGDRRFFVIRSKTVHYTKELQILDHCKGWLPGYFDWLKKDGGIEAVADYLMAFDLSSIEGFNPHQAPLLTEAKHYIISASRSELFTYINEALMEKRPPFDRDFISSDEIRQGFSVSGNGKATNPDILSSMEELEILHKRTSVRVDNKVLKARLFCIYNQAKWEKEQFIDWYREWSLKKDIEEDVDAPKF